MRVEIKARTPTVELPTKPHKATLPVEPKGGIFFVCQYGTNLHRVFENHREAHAYIVGFYDGHTETLNDPTFARRTATRLVTEALAEWMKHYDKRIARLKAQAKGNTDEQEEST